MHKLVVKQLLKNGVGEVPDHMAGFIGAVETAYIEYERDIHLMERSIDISNREYNEVNDKLKTANQALTAMHEELSYLSYHDVLTGLYNRAFMNKALERLQNDSVPIGVIVCDTDGLKLVNDSFGHAVGDEYLAEAARYIAGCIREGDIACRFGGDEFAVFLPGATEEIVLRVIDKLNKRLSSPENMKRSIPISLSYGCSVKNKIDKSLLETMKEADSHMYKVKLLRAQSSRSSVVQTLMTMLSERDLVTEEHAVRLEKMVEWFGGLLAVPTYVGTNLKLLAKFHDIGKSAVPDDILKKPGGLTPAERKKMQQHSEVGFRIANTSLELAPIAQLILMHHEWWNGSGYPMGIAGDEIPLECRILAIIDAYDAMTSDRPYRKAMPREAALEEILRFSGIQFDPQLVTVFVSAVRTKKTSSFEAVAFSDKIPNWV